jgi:hypothetical protein
MEAHRIVWRQGSHVQYIYIYNFKLTNFLDPSPPWKAASCAATQELPKILWNPKVHYRVHKNTSGVPILSQINPVLTTPSYLSEILFNIIRPPTSGLHSGLFPSDFPTNILYEFLFSTFVLHALPVSSSVTLSF